MRQNNVLQYKQVHLAVIKPSDKSGGLLHI